MEVGERLEAARRRFLRLDVVARAAAAAASRDEGAARALAAAEAAVALRRAPDASLFAELAASPELEAGEGDVRALAEGTCAELIETAEGGVAAAVSAELVRLAAARAQIGAMGRVGAAGGAHGAQLEALLEWHRELRHALLEHRLSRAARCADASAQWLVARCAATCAKLRLLLTRTLRDTYGAQELAALSVIRRQLLQQRGALLERRAALQP